MLRAVGDFTRRAKAEVLEEKVRTPGWEKEEDP
jgi:hypothetical protein